MTKTLLHLSLTALLAVSTVAGAQESSTDGEAAANDSGALSAPAAGLDTGREVTEENESYIKETHGDWSLRCFPGEADEDICQMYQLLTGSEGNPVAEFMLYRIGGAGNIAAGATIAVPLGTLLTEEVKLSVDDGNAKSYAYSFCTMGGCFSRIGLTEAEVAALKKGAQAQIEIIPAQAPNQTVRINVSLSGFTAAYEAASTLDN
ncbi:invasion associated locus B family protein [Roseovarius ramblicola]|uniref:Invasion associated locus B family protein n=1 Tax=Roseovarius ramblicola TaxID=2022336 RepID=A0ABV5I0W9_9RHOB